MPIYLFPLAGFMPQTVQFTRQPLGELSPKHNAEVHEGHHAFPCHVFDAVSGPCIQAESSMALTVQTKPRQLLVLHNRKTVEPVELS